MQDRAQIERVGDFLIIRAVVRTGSGEDLILQAVRVSQITGVEQRRLPMLTGPDPSSSRPSALLHFLDGESMWFPGWTMEEIVPLLSREGSEQESPRAQKEEETDEVVTETLRADGLLSYKTVSPRIFGKKEVPEAIRADSLTSYKTVSPRIFGKKEVLQNLVAACHYQLGLVHLELTEPVPADEFSWETGQRAERRQGKLDAIFSVLHAAEQALRELG